MENDLKELKSVLRSLVVSSPAQVDVRTLLRDYRAMVGQPLPLTRYGYRDPVAFLRERFDDCFLFQGYSGNPVLTLIVPDTLKHIDKFVQKQKSSNVVKFKGKRRSVQEMISQPSTNLIVSTFRKRDTETDINSNPVTVTPVRDRDHNENICKEDNHQDNVTSGKECEVNDVAPPKEDVILSNSALVSFMRKRLPAYNSTQSIENGDTHKDMERPSSKGDDDSGRQTSSSNSRSKWMRLEDLKMEIRDLLADHPGGVLCTDLMKLYMERYGRELNFRRFGYTSILSLVSALDDVAALRGGAGGWLVGDARRPPPPAPRAAARPAPPATPATPATPASSSAHSYARLPVDPDDALPGIDFEAAVFPADCVHFVESVRREAAAGLRPGAMLGVRVAEVYSPAHLWLLRLGPRHLDSLDRLMDRMTEYYTAGEGRDRRLATGAVRVGHTCCSLYDGDWHRSLIVKVIDSDTVKVRHIDYGTVSTVSASGLKPLRREWASLPAQAQRARLAGVRPARGAPRWPLPAAAHLLRLVRDKRLVANLVAVDTDEDILEVFLIDTSSEEDVCVSSQLIAAGYAEARSDSSLGTAETYLFPLFAALEDGDTPSYAEIHAYLRDGIALEYVDDYRRHVPPPPAPRLRAAPPSPPPRAALGVTLSAAECDVYRALARLEPAAAHWYMVQAMERARIVHAATQTEPPAPPPPPPPPPPPGFDETHMIRTLGTKFSLLGD